MAGGTERNVLAELKPIFLASLREEFDSVFPASNLALLLGKVEVQQKLQHMRKTELLSTDEWQDLFPTPETQGNSTTFDVPLLFKLIREFSDLEPPVTGWDDVARHNDHSLSADIVKIVQCYRTLYGQSDETELGYSVVEDNLSIMNDVLKRRSPVIYEIFKLLQPTKIQLNPICLAFLREEFDTLFPASSLALLLGKVEVQQKLQHMRTTGLLSTDEWQDLFPTPETQGKSTTFDVPLLFKLIREFSDLEPPVTGWDDVARHNDHSLSADIVKIVQCYRTLYGQSDKTESDSVVEDNLFIMEDVLKRRSPAIYDKFLSFEPTKKNYKDPGSEKKKNIPETTQSTSTETEPQPTIKTGFQEYEKKQAEIRKSIAMHTSRNEHLENIIEQRQTLGQSVHKQKEVLTKKQQHLQELKIDLQLLKMQSPRTFRSFAAEAAESSVRNRMHCIEPDEFESEDSITRRYQIESRYHGIDAALPTVFCKIKRNEFAIKQSTSTETEPQPTIKAGVQGLPFPHLLPSFTSTLTLSSKESSLCKLGNPTVMLKALKARHASVIQASKFDSNQQLKRHEELINYVMKLSPKDSSLKSYNTSIVFESITNMTDVLGKLGLDSDTTPTSQVKDFTDRQISEDEVIPAYLKIASRQIQALHQKNDRVYCVVPYHYSGQTAVVIYAHDPTADLYTKDWSREFLGFPVFIVDLTYGYETYPLIFPECLPQISEDTYVKCSEVKDEVTRELTKKHSNISTVCVDYRIKGNKIVEGEICIQIGVLTKGFVPLGEQCLPRVFDDVAVDVIESNASFCGKPKLRVYPINLGVGIGVEGDGDSTGSLGAVVKLNKQQHLNELFILSNAHVLYRKDATTLSITQPSQQEYKEKQDEIETSIEMYVSDIEQLENIIEQRQTLGQSVCIEEEELTKKRENLQESKDDLQYIFDEQRPRTIGSFTAKTEYFVRNPMYSKKPKYYGIDAATAKIKKGKFEPEDRMTIEPKCYGIDAAIAKIEIRDRKFAKEAITKMYTWPVKPYLVDEGNNKIMEIQLNGKLMDEQTIRRSLKEKDTVFKCGKGSGVTKGVLYTEINVRMTGGFENFIQDGLHTVSNASDKPWCNVLYIKSTTKRGGRDTRSFSEPGDSGAVVFDESGTCVGLLFGRIDTQLSPQGGGLATPIHAVFEALNVSLATPEDLQHLLIIKNPVP